MNKRGVWIMVAVVVLGVVVAGWAWGRAIWQKLIELHGVH